MNLHDALIKPKDTTVLEVARILTPEGEPLGTRLEIVQKEPDPVLARSAQAAHWFFDVDTFTHYLNQYAVSGQCLVLADQKALHVSAVLDETATLGGRQVVTYKLLTHPLFAPWEAVIGTPMTLDALIKMLRVHRRSVLNGKEILFDLSQIRASEEVTVHKGTGRRALNGLLVKTDIKGAKGEELVELPESIALTLPLFVGSPATTIELDLLLQVRKGEVTAVLTNGDLQVVRLQEFDRVVEQVRSGVTIEAVIGLGSVVTAPWSEQ